MKSHQMRTSPSHPSSTQRAYMSQFYEIMSLITNNYSFFSSTNFYPFPPSQSSVIKRRSMVPFSIAKHIKLFSLLNHFGSGFILGEMWDELWRNLCLLPPRHGAKPATSWNIYGACNHIMSVLLPKTEFAEAYENLLIQQIKAFSVVKSVSIMNP